MRDATSDAQSREWRAEIADRLTSLRLSPAAEADLADELSQHLEDRFRELRLRGMTDTEARRVVLEELDGDGSLASKLRDVVRRGTVSATLGTPAGGNVLGSCDRTPATRCEPCSGRQVSRPWLCSPWR